MSYFHNNQKRKFSFLILFFLLLIHTVHGQGNKLYTTADGLSNTFLQSIIQDKEGFIWIATENGLNRFDGFTFKVYPKISDLSNANTIRCLFESSDGILWVGTYSGIFQYDRNHDIFLSHPVFYDNKQVFPEIKSISEDKSGNIWMSSSFGLIKNDRLTKQSKFILDIKSKGTILTYKGLNVSIIDKKGMLWISNWENGFLNFDTNTEKVVDLHLCLDDKEVASVFQDTNEDIIWGTNKGNVYVYRNRDKKIISCKHATNTKSFRPIYCIAKDSINRIFIGTQGNGLQYLDKSNFQIKDISNMINLDEASDFRINKIYTDKDKNMWFGIQSLGLYFIKGENLPFHSYQKNKSNGSGINYNVVKSIMLDSNNDLYVGTDGGGLNVLKQHQKQFKSISSNREISKVIPDNAITALFEDSKKQVWVGTYIKGLLLYNKQNNSFQNIKVSNPENELNTNFITSIVEDDSENLWIGTNGEQLFKYAIAHHSLQRIPIISDKKNKFHTPECIISLLFDSKKRLWIGSYHGVLCWDKKKDDIKNYTVENRKLASNTVVSLTETKSGELAIGTTEGLTMLNPETRVVRHISKANGLSDATINGILEDNEHRLWASTKNGLSCIDEFNYSVVNYFTNSGLPSNEFREGAYFKGVNGYFYFGSTQGVVYFNPDSIKPKEIKRPVYLSDFVIFNETVPINSKYRDTRIILTENINNKTSLHLLHAENHVTFKFSTIYYDNPENIKYSYILEGLEKNWTTATYRQNYATYTNLTPGKYTFRVKIISNNAKAKTPERVLSILISPPFWLTWWAYMVYAGIIGGMIWLSHRLIVSRLEMQQQLKIEHLKLEHQNAIHHSKMELFTNLSHEIRTPLTLILGPIESLLQTNPGNLPERYLRVMQQNVYRILTQVNKLLNKEFTEQQELILNVGSYNFQNIVTSVLSLFMTQKEEKNIKLKIASVLNSEEGWFDKEKLETIIFNLLSNAFKYTPEEGSISIKISTNIIAGVHSLCFEISNSGKGIPTSQLPKIFERFYHTNSDQKENNAGKGIGLHLTKSLVNLHGGEISVDSSLGNGAMFSFVIPIERSAYQVPEVFPPVNILPSLIKETSENTNMLENKHKQFTVLLIEDDSEVRNYLKMELMNEYYLLESSNGKAGQILAGKRMPDLIVTDLMMPEMDGFELCKILKTNIQTCHIPIIMLTALTSENQLIKGYETGADEYITKPFNPTLLKIRIAKLIALRETLKNKFLKSVSFEAKEMTINSTDEAFLQRAMEWVKKNIADPELNIENMSKEIGMSRTQMYRKLKALTDQTPSEFVRIIRLKQAAYLLKKQTANISEIAFMVGFNSHQYFSTCFQQTFNMTPTEYAQKE